MTTVLSTDQFLSTGDDLWIIADPTSSLFQRLDWLLNLQLSRAMRQVFPQKSNAISQILKQSQLPNYDFTEFTDDDNPNFTLVASQNVLPCVGVLLPPAHVSFMKKPASLVQKIEEKMQGLKLQRARLFLPQGFNAGEASDYFQDEDLSWSLVVPKGDEKWI